MGGSGHASVAQLFTPPMMIFIASKLLEETNTEEGVMTSWPCPSQSVPESPMRLPRILSRAALIGRCSLCRLSPVAFAIN